MIVASKEFFIFLLVTLISYHLIQGRQRKYQVLALASWFFYFMAAPQYLWVLLLLTVVDYLAALRIESKAPVVASTAGPAWQAGATLNNS